MTLFQDAVEGEVLSDQVCLFALFAKAFDQLDLGQAVLLEDVAAALKPGIFRPHR